MEFTESNNNRKFMRLALEIAFSRLGRTSPNPSVGAVIVKDDKIISRGGTSIYGHDHAEVVAINNAERDLLGSELYVSLEPCSHYGRTPPCTEAIIQSKITRVYIPILDPNPLVAGKGVARLREAGVDVVILSDMAECAFDLIRHFKKYILYNKAYIIHKSAITLDGKIAATGGDSKWISSEYSRYIVHRLRSIVDAIIIGKNTLFVDNPSLNVRLNSFSDDVKQYYKNCKLQVLGKANFFLEMLLRDEDIEIDRTSYRVIVGLPDNLNFVERIFFDDKFIFFVDEKKRDGLRKRRDYKILQKLILGDKIVFIRGDTPQEHVSNIIDILSQLGMAMLLLEGGGIIAGSFFDVGEIDQFFYFITPKIIGSGKSPIEGEGVTTIQDSLKLCDISTIMIKDDILYNAYKEPFLK